MIRKATMFPLLAASALLAIGGGACGGGTRAHGGAGGGAAGMPVGGGGGAGAGGGGAGGANACGPLLPTAPPATAAMLGLVQTRLVAAGRRDANFAAVFGDATDAVLAASDALQAQAVEAAAADRLIPTPAVPPGEVPDHASCGVTDSALTASALTSAGSEWATASFLATGNLLVALDGTRADADYPQLDMDLTFSDVKTHMHQTTHVTVNLTASHAVAVVSMTRTASATTASGVLLGSTTENAMATIDVDFCPDAEGVAAGMITFGGDGVATAAGGAVPTTYQVQATGAYKIHVNDQAETSAVDLDGSLQFSASGGSTVDVAATFSGGYTDVANPGGTARGQITLQRANGWAADISTTDNAIYAASMLASMVAEQGARKKWRGGACVEVRVNPGTMMVDENAAITVMASPFQKFEMAELKAPVVATFKGERSLTPVNQPVPAPAAFQFVAGNKMGAAGIVDLKSTSRRGIGTGTATYTVKCGEVEKKMCADLGQTLNPDTCKCECRIDPLIGNPSPSCKWVGTVGITANESGQLDQPFADLQRHTSWSLDYSALLSAAEPNGTVLTGNANVSWREFDAFTSPGPPPCTLTYTTDGTQSASVTQGLFLIQGGATAGQLSFVVRVPSMAVGMTTTTYTGADCMDDLGLGSGPLGIDGIFHGAGTPARSTFAGSSVDPNGVMLPDGTHVEYKVSWDLKLVPF